MKTATTYLNLYTNREMGNWADSAATLEHGYDCSLEFGFAKINPEDMK